MFGTSIYTKRYDQSDEENNDVSPLYLFNLKLIISRLWIPPFNPLKLIISNILPPSDESQCHHIPIRKPELPSILRFRLREYSKISRMCHRRGFASSSPHRGIMDSLKE